MSDPFFKFLSGTSVNGDRLFYKSYSHATQLYLNDKLGLTPKLGFLYFVSFEFNPYAPVPLSQDKDHQYDIGMLVKNISLPKFKVTTETINQYNRKTNIQTKITYDPIDIEFHDDNLESTNLLWQNYFSYYYSDSVNHPKGEIGKEFSYDTKYGVDDYQYGYNIQSQAPFLNAINIFVLHQGKFSQYTIGNPIISSWNYDKVDRSEYSKILGNKMTVVYDTVSYYQGSIQESDKASQYKARYYDNSPAGLDYTNSTEPTVGQQSKNRLATAQQTTTPKSPLSLSEKEKYLSSLPTGETLANSNTLQPFPIGYGTWSLGQTAAPGVNVTGIDLWYGAGGLHGKATINAGPISLAVKK